MISSKFLMAFQNLHVIYQVLYAQVLLNAVTKDRLVNNDLTDSLGFKLNISALYINNSKYFHKKYLCDELYIS